VVSGSRELLPHVVSGHYCMANGHHSTPFQEALCQGQDQDGRLEGRFVLAPPQAATVSAHCSLPWNPALIPAAEKGLSYSGATDHTCSQCEHKLWGVCLSQHQCQPASQDRKSQVNSPFRKARAGGHRQRRKCPLPLSPQTQAMLDTILPQHPPFWCVWGGGRGHCLNPSWVAVVQTDQVTGDKETKANGTQSVFKEPQVPGQP
jgi:hypothetical protein